MGWGESFKKLLQRGETEFFVPLSSALRGPGLVDPTGGFYFF